MNRGRWMHEAPMNDELITMLGDELYDALKACRVVDPLTTRHPGISIEDAYRIQQRLNARRVQAGETVVGKKIGVTSKAVMNMLGVYQPDFGILLDGMVYNEGQAIEAAFDQDNPFSELPWCVKAEPPCRVGFDPTSGSARSVEHGLVRVLIHPWFPPEQRAPDEPLSVGGTQREDDASDPTLQER